MDVKIYSDEEREITPLHVCMLYEIYCNWGKNEDELLKRVHVFAQEDTKIWEFSDRLKYASDWMEEKSSIDILGHKGFKPYDCIRTFSTHTSNILELIVDALQPKTFEELIDSGFGDG